MGALEGGAEEGRGWGGGKKGRMTVLIDGYDEKKSTAGKYTGVGLTLAVQHGFGLEVELRGVWLGGDGAQGAGRERQGLGL